MKNNMNKKQIYGKPNYSDDVKKITIISVVVIVVLLLVYLLTALASGEIKLGNKDNKTKTEASIQYEEIIAGEVLNRNKSEYYVMFFNFTDEKSQVLLSLKDQYGYVDNSLYVYLVDLDKSFNDILTPEKDENIIENPSTISELKVKDTSLLKIKDGKVISRITSYDSVKEELEKLSK